MLLVHADVGCIILTVPQKSLVRIPDYLSYQEASTLPLVFRILLHDHRVKIVPVQQMHGRHSVELLSRTCPTQSR